MPTLLDLEANFRHGHLLFGITEHGGRIGFWCHQSHLAGWQFACYFIPVKVLGLGEGIKKMPYHHFFRHIMCVWAFLVWTLHTNFVLGLVGGVEFPFFSPIFLTRKLNQYCCLLNCPPTPFITILHIKSCSILYSWLPPNINGIIPGVLLMVSKFSYCD